MRTLSALPLFLALIVAGGCGGDGGDAISDLGPRGVGISAENPNILLAGRTTEILVYGRAVTSSEQNANITVEASTSVGTLNETEWTQFVPNANSVGYHALRLTLPADTPAGTAVSIRVFRTTERVAGHPKVDEETMSFTVGAATIQGTLVDAEVTGAAGTTVSTTLGLLPTGNASGAVTLVGLVNGATLSPNQVTLTEGQTTPAAATVSYTIPAGALSGTVIPVPVAWQSNAGHGTATLLVHVGAVVEPDFALTLDRASLNIAPGDSAGMVTVTVTPEPGFRGDVSVAFTHPSPSVSLSPPTANPFTLSVTSDAPVAGTFRVRWNSQQGLPQGAATITATSGSHTHSASLNLIAS